MEDSWSNEAFRPITRDEKYLMNYNQNYSLLINSKSTKKVNLPFSRGGGEGGRGKEGAASRRLQPERAGHAMTS